MASRTLKSRAAAVTVLSVVAVGCGDSSRVAPRTTPSSAGEGGDCANCPAGTGGEGGSDAGGSDAGGSDAGGGASGSGQPGGAASLAEAGSPSLPAPSLSLRSISISQTHELPLMAAGEIVPLAKRPAPLVSGKRALVRAFADLEPGFSRRPLLGVLDLDNGGRVSSFVSERTLGASSLQDDLTTTFVFDVPGGELTTSATYRVRVLEADTTELTRFPSEAFVALGAKRVEPFELVMVPLVVAGHAPKLDAGDVEALRARLVAIYPVSDVAISIADKVTLGYAVDGEGAGWDDALDDLYAYRQSADPPDNVFFYGMMAPSTTFANYCNTSCVLGYSVIADEDDIASRGSIGITIFPDGSGARDAWDTVAHELGHALGRDHSNCGLNIEDPADPGYYDADYPYPNAGMGGIYGFDFASMRLVKPKSYRDVMSYCAPVWISDYTYRALDERLDYIVSTRFRVLGRAEPTLEWVARIKRDGSTRWLPPRVRRAPGAGGALSVPLLDNADLEVGRVSARFSQLDHAAGGYVSLPSAELSLSPGAVAVDLRSLGGAILPL